MPQRHPYDEIALELAAWIDQTAKFVAEAMMSSGRGPFTVQPKPAEALMFYDTQLFLPDGTPNISGRTREMERLGPTQFARMFRLVLRARERGVQSVLEELSAPAVEQAGGTGEGEELSGLLNNQPVSVETRY